MEPYEISKITLAIAETMRGNPDAYTIIVTAYMQKLYRKALTMTKNSAAAEDLVQETFIDGYLHLYDLREPEKIEGWLMRILKNKTLNHLTRARKTEPEEVLYSLSDRRSPEALYESVETLDEWKKKLHSLPGAQREVALLYFLTELTMEEIAERTRLPLGTVKRRIHDARATLRKETEMTEKEKLPDSFAVELSKKIKDLESYTNIYGNVGFDDAYRNVKTLISNLSDAENVEKYSIESAKIAAMADMFRYQDEALDIFRKYGDVKKASELMDIIRYKRDGGMNKAWELEYSKNKIIPELLLYPESEDRSFELAMHYSYIADSIDKSTPEGAAEAEKYIKLSLSEYEKTKLVDFYHGVTAAKIKALSYYSDDRSGKTLITGAEVYRISDNNLFLENCVTNCPVYSDLIEYICSPFILSSNNSSTHYVTEKENDNVTHEKLIDENGNVLGFRRVISRDETVITPAGEFENCLHVQFEDKSSGNKNDIWYKKDVGIVKSTVEKEEDAKILSSYHIVGGDGYLPIAVGNTWNYVTPNKPDAIYEHNEFSIIRIGKCRDEDFEAILFSCVNYVALDTQWENISDDPSYMISSAQSLCEENKFEEAAEKLRSVITMNKTPDSVDRANALFDYVSEALEYKKHNWRVCPSSASINEIHKTDDKLIYQNIYASLTLGPYGTRSEENRIFGVKPFRYLQGLCGTLWSDKWIPGYTEDIEDEDDGEGIIHLKVTDGGTVVTPAGTFDNTVRLSIDFEVEGNRDDYFHYFYSHTYSGLKEFWFAPGVGIVRHTCKWGKHMDSEAVLTEYRAVAKDGEMFPVHIGNYWKYDEVNLTRENYIARFDCKIISGTNGKYNAVLAQMFTYKGTVEEYEEFKRKIAKKV